MFNSFKKRAGDCSEWRVPAVQSLFLWLFVFICKKKGKQEMCFLLLTA